MGTEQEEEGSTTADDGATIEPATTVRWQRRAEADEGELGGGCLSVRPSLGKKGNGLGFMIAGDLEAVRQGIAVVEHRGESAGWPVEGPE